MKPTTLLFFAIFLAIPALAAPPQKPDKRRYTPLWTNSPFTVKPPPNIPTGPPPVNPMDNYALGGFTKFPDGYFVVLINKKDPKQKEVIQPGSHSDFKVLKVTEGVEKIVDGKLVNEGASVLLSSGSMQGEVKYDEKILAMKAASNPGRANGNNNGNNGQNRPILPPGVNVPSPGNNPNFRQPRVRTLPPPVIPQPQTSAPQIPQNQQGQNIQNILPVQ